VLITTVKVLKQHKCTQNVSSVVTRYCTADIL